MAKLSAHGVELVRIDVIIPRTEPQYATDTVTEDRVVYSVRSDGHILRRELCKGIHSNSPDEWHDFGWKLWEKARKGASVQDVADRFVAYYTEYGETHAEASVTVKDCRPKLRAWGHPGADTDRWQHSK